MSKECRVDNQEVEKILRLSKLEASENELEAFTEEFNSILAFFETLQSVDTDGVEEMAHIHNLTNVFREDNKAAPMETQKSLTNSPDSQNNYFKVPLVIE